jgi:hypothetical protein
MRTFRIPMLVAAATCLIAAPVWETKSASQWTEEDARQVLAKSPWSKPTRAVITRRLTEEQLSEGGKMGLTRGIGNEGVDPKCSGPKVSPNILTGPGGGDRSPRSVPQSITFATTLGERPRMARKLDLIESRLLARLVGRSRLSIIRRVHAHSPRSVPVSSDRLPDG